MLKRNITYETFNDPPETITETYYFNLTVPEIAAMNPEATLEDNWVAVAKMDEIILQSYGVKSEDGKNFEKSDELRKKFETSAAYSALFAELAFNDNALEAFIRGVLPKQAADELTKILSEQKAKTTELPAPPTT